ncbi:class I SAM-dependent methyltransferase [[Clostridium] polysaccharolyticum]|uniref:Methyltransferase domain-containing protein n=1 Tax=[Clostridium] polysaccharolyticum TaxID=29364 RepID=A0A1I0BSX1_9FIRM|nr:SAM-dependent methyltransferase [[Clostridium] polysaccharolyticum]SET09735.1 Methyltransferase domain-containing protein [[Clostridium] polysaccharolyticum]
MEVKDVEKLSAYIDENLVDIIISNAQGSGQMKKVKVRAVHVKEQTKFQVTSYQGTKVYHKNYNREDFIKLLEQFITGYEIEEQENAVVKFKQVVIRTTKEQVTALFSKKGKMTLKASKLKQELPKPIFEHNRRKRYILEEGTAVPFLVDLGVMTKEGKIVQSKYDKYRQINRFLEFVEDIVEELPQDRELTILDFGCGKSYLTFALYYYFKKLKRYDINIIGLDLKDDVIRTCNRLASKYEYDKLKFLHGNISDYEELEKVDMVVTLHACDTATDFALQKAILWDAKVILSVPCCQHEINQQIKCEQLETVLKYGLLKERISALLTDGLRAELLECNGYRTQILEFIDMEHTPKNILIRAVKQESGKKKTPQDYERLVEFLHVQPALGALLGLNPERKDKKIGMKYHETRV